MRFQYPRSFLKLLCVGFALIALPLMVALIHNAVSIDRLRTLSQQTVYQAVRATQNSRRLAELIPAMERTAHQVLILGDRTLLETYVRQREQLFDTAGQFTALPFDTEQREALREILAEEAEIYRLLSDPATPPAVLQKALEGFVELGERAASINWRSNELINREVEILRETARQAHRMTLWQLLALFPVVIFLVVGFTILIARPIRQIDAAIRRLGHADFTTAVEVRGPEDLQQLGEGLDQMRRRLAELEQQKNRFLRHMSHELKTPLTALREGAELLSEEVVGALTPEQREIAEILRHNSIELQKLIEDLLCYGASQARRPSLDVALVELRRIVERVASDQKLALRAKGLRLSVSVPDVMLRGDFEKLRVMLDNLVSNAIKFSPAGGAVAIDARELGDEIEIEVSDEGPGIAPEERALVFEPFYRGRHAADALVKGTGIGLSVVRDHALLHGGHAEVVDAGPGAHIRVRLPRVAAAQPAREVGQTAMGAAS
jgi:two-component system, NtrC family, sensor histidine kinase GlrK